jgi:uncharacterized protein YhaN
MAADSLQFRRIEIRRMPGFPTGSGFVLDDLSGGLNIVYGPNASGKTTTARAIEALLWPGVAAPRDASVVGRLVHGGAEWLIDLDAGRLRSQRNGVDTSLSGMPPPESRDRYRLWLPELLAESGKVDRFAAAVLHESAGGYDLARAAEALGFRAAASQPRKLSDRFQSARAAVEEARTGQRELVAEEARLAELEPEREKAAFAARRARLLELALAHADARTAEEDAQRSLAGFPDGFAKLRGDEGERLAALERRLASARGDEAKALEARDRALEQRVATRLPAEGVPGDLVPGLREDIRSLRVLETTVENLERDRAAAEAERTTAARAIGEAVDEHRLAALNPVGFDGLVELAERGAALRAHRQELEAKRRWLGGGGELPDIGHLQESVYRLQDWLRVAEPRSGARRERRLFQLLLVALVLVAAAGIVLGVLLHWALFGLVLIAGVLAWDATRREVTVDPRRAIEQEFGGARLDPPAEWVLDTVRDHLRSLEERLAEGRFLHEKARRAEQLEEERLRLQAEAKELAAFKGPVLAKLGLPPETDEVKLHLLANRISRWQDGCMRVASAVADLEEARRQHASLLRSMADRLARFGYVSIGSSAAAAGAVEDLDVRRQGAHDAEIGLRNAEAALEAARHRIEELRAERTRLFAAVGLPEAAGELLQEWCSRYADYVSSRQEWLIRTRARESAARELSQQPGYRPELADRAAVELREQLERAREQAARLEELARTVTEIRTRIAEAKLRHDLEAALAHRDDAEAALRDARERDVEAVLGSLLIEYAQDRTRDQHRPEVFHRARQVFAAITRGRYRLDFDDGDPPAFRAQDSATGMGHSLDELSSGTRVQLLLAVRLAFVETQERGIRLPLLFDETLANADDQRAQAIMDATVELAAAGRQIFYFTAQADEVGKWLALLETRAGVAHRLLDLARLRRLGQHDTLPPPAPTVSSIVRLPAPDGMSYAEYGRALHVGPLDPLLAQPEGVHLWHLLESPHELHGLLELGIERWGALRTFVDHGGRAHPTVDGIFERAAAAASALERLLALFRIGRGRPLDRALLIESGAITETFLDRVTELCERHGGDAELVLRALAAGEVARFRSETREQLRDYLERVGCLDAREPLPLDEIRTRALAAMAAELEGGLLSRAQLERMVSALAHTLGPQPAGCTS